MDNNLPYMTDKEMNKIYVELLLKYVSKLLKCIIKMLFQMARQSLILAIKNTLKTVVDLLVTMPFKRHTFYKAKWR